MSIYEAAETAARRTALGVELQVDIVGRVRRNVGAHVHPEGRQLLVGAVLLLRLEAREGLPRVRDEDLRALRDGRRSHDAERAIGREALPRVGSVRVVGHVDHRYEHRLRRRGCRRRRRGKLRPWEAVMRLETRVPFQGWRMMSYTTYDSIREQVNAVIAL